MKRKTILELITFLLILLWVYAGVSKLIDYHNFKLQLAGSPVPIINETADYLRFLLPVAEIGVAILLGIKAAHKAGLYASLILLLIFTAYIISLFTFYSHNIPCSCGGVIELLGWKGHLIFNISYILIDITALWLQSNSRIFSLRRELA